MHGPHTRNYYHHDALGSVVNLTDTYSYTAFGNQRARSGTDAQPYQYLENAYDPTTKLYDFHARVYDQSTGRFTSKDPISGLTVVPQSLNPYPYGVNGPLAYPDPSGEIALPLVAIAAVDVGAIYGVYCVSHIPLAYTFRLQAPKAARAPDDVNYAFYESREEDGRDGESHNQRGPRRVGRGLESGRP